MIFYKMRASDKLRNKSEYKCRSIGFYALAIQSFSLLLIVILYTLSRLMSQDRMIKNDFVEYML